MKNIITLVFQDYYGNTLPQIRARLEIFDFYYDNNKTDISLIYTNYIKMYGRAEYVSRPDWLLKKIFDINSEKRIDEIKKYLKCKNFQLLQESFKKLDEFLQSEVRLDEFTKEPKLYTSNFSKVIETMERSLDEFYKSLL